MLPATGLIADAPLLVRAPPLVAAKQIDAKTISANSLSGISGAGRSAKQELLFTELDGGVSAYGIGRHRHMAEIEQELAKAAGADIRISFTPHLVPLSRQAVAVLQLAVAENGYDTHSGVGLVFPGRDRARPIGEGALRDLYDRALRLAQDERLIGRRHVPHGWRSSFSTILNEELGEGWRSAIDRALAHSPKDKVEAAYNRAELLARRRELFDRWGEMLSPP